MFRIHVWRVRSLLFGVINVSKVEVSCGPKKIPLSFCGTDSSWASRYYHVPWGKRMTSAGLKIGLRVIDKGPGLPREKGCWDNYLQDFGKGHNSDRQITKMQSSWAWRFQDI